MPQPDYSPSADRNKQPILDVLQKLLPRKGTALEIASGTGQHVAWFAKNMLDWTWQPTDFHPGALLNIEMRANDADLVNVLESVQLDVCNEPWFAQGSALAAAFAKPSFDLILCINMLHIAPWAACPALMRGASQYLAPGGVLVTYGPYFEADVTPTPSNVEFDISLREQNATWGIRQITDVTQEAANAGLHLRERHAMPANNLLLVWARENG
jgi:ubiquinone/menaquinone biosynthesis C-methylase UbiE